MENEEIYKMLAKAISARKNSLKNNNTEWVNHWEYKVNDLIDQLPHGSGLDSEWALDEKSTGEKLILHQGYHTMNENGMYDRWINFTLTVTGSLMFGIDIKIVGNFGKDQDLKTYLYDILSLYHRY